MSQTNDCLQICRTAWAHICELAPEASEQTVQAAATSPAVLTARDHLDAIALTGDLRATTGAARVWYTVWRKALTMEYPRA